MSTDGGSKEALERALGAARDAGNAAEEARILRELAAIERAGGHDWRARRLLESALEIYRDTSDLRGVTQVLSELEPVAEAEDTSVATDATGAKGDASDLIRMTPAAAPPQAPPARGARIPQSPPPRGSQREGTSWPVAVGFLVLLVLVGGGLAFLGVRLVGDLLGGDEDTETAPELSPVPATVEPSPAITRLPANNERLVARPISCDVTSSEVFTEVTMQVDLQAPEDYQVAVLRGTLTARGGRELGQGIQPVTPLERGSRRVEMTFTVFEEIPRGRLTCGVEILNAVELP